MRCDLKVIILILNSNVLTEQLPGVCSISSQGNPTECCWNYKLVGNTCTACTPGTFGKNCERECPEGLYGQFCKENCSCDPCDSCDKVTGCLNKTKKCDSEAKHDSILLHWPSILISLIGTGAVCFTFCSAIMCIFRKKKPAIRKCVVSTMHEKDLAATQNVYDHIGDSYNVLKLKASSSGIL